LRFSSIRATARQRCNGSLRVWLRISVEILAARALIGSNNNLLEEISSITLLLEQLDLQVRN
jgi:hypothetical protein